MKLKSNHLADYLDSLEKSHREDVERLIPIFSFITGYPPMLWGSIIGFGHLRYTYPTGHSGEMPLLSFSRRKTAITIYLGYDAEALLNDYSLGKYQIGKGCLYIKQLNDIDLSILKEVLTKAKNTLLAYDFIKPL